MDGEEIPLEGMSYKERKKYEEYEEPKQAFPPADAETPLKIVPRDAWGAAPPTSKQPLCCPMDLVMILDTGTEPCHDTDQCLRMVKELQTFYMEKKGLPDIPWK